MPRKKHPIENEAAAGYIKNAGVVIERPIDAALEENYMPYAMSVIMSRAIPEIDGFKPSHRKLLYTMYKMGLLTGIRQKSSKIAGATMTLNPHGDAAIYETMVRMTAAYEALLHPFVDSKGIFGKAYSRDTAPAAARYTEAKLAELASELFRDIDSDAVDFVDNFDATEKEPVLLPVTFPSILCNNNTGIAVGMASSICSFNLSEVVDTTIALIRNPGHDVTGTLLAPDFPGGGYIISPPEALSEVYRTGRGGVRVRGRYSYDKSQGCIDITQIPPSTTIEQIIEKVVDLVKQGKIREVSDIRDETDKHGLHITIELKRGTDPDRLMQKLFKMTPLEDNFSCNFNILIAGKPVVLGVADIINEWVAFRVECVRRRVFFDLNKKKKRLHLLNGLGKILLDIDKAIKIIRETEEEADVVPNLMIGFGIDEVQAEYVAEIKLRHINKEYILKRIDDITRLKDEIKNLEEILESERKVKGIIIDELKDVSKKYGQTRRSMILRVEETPDELDFDDTPDYPVNLFFTKEGYFKKITPQSLRMSGEHKLKEGDELFISIESSNNTDLLFFTDKYQVYKAKAADFADTKASVMGDYVPAKLQMEDGERAVGMIATKDYSGYVIFAFENGKIAKVELSSYSTKTNRKKLLSAYSDKSPLIAIIHMRDNGDILMTSSSGRRLLVHTGAITAKTTKNTLGVQVMTQRKNHRLMSADIYAEETLLKPHRYRSATIPSSGAVPSQEELGEQVKLV